MVNEALRDRILKATTLDTTSLLPDSIIFKDRDVISTPIPIINVALSGRIDGGMLPGILQLAGPPKHFKTAFGLLMITSFLQSFPDGVVLFYDSEFGTPKSYFNTFNINPENVIHCPVTNIEELKFDITAQLKQLTAEDKIIIFIDSIGNLASLKEVEDAEAQKSVTDMTRAKAIKSLCRIMGPQLVLKNIPMIMINHTYSTLELYASQVVGGGTGTIYNSNDIWIIGRQQEKDSNKDLSGWNFIINIEKSRTIKEKSKIPVTVTFDSGIQKCSALFDLALESGLFVTEKKGWYKFSSNLEPAFKRGDIENDWNFWKPMLESFHFKTFIETKYRLPDNMMGKEDEQG